MSEQTRHVRDGAEAPTSVASAILSAAPAPPALIEHIRLASETAADTASGMTSSITGAVKQLQNAVFSGASASEAAVNAPRTADGFSAPAGPGAAHLIRELTSILPGYAEGGRVSRPVIADPAEHGAPEYAIPARDSERAPPLIRELLTDLAAYRPGRILTRPADAAAETPFISAAISAAPAAQNRIAAQNAAAPTQITVNAPCTFNISVPDSDPRAVGEAVSEAAERTLTRAISSALCTALGSEMSGYYPKPE